VRLMIWKVQ